MPVAPHYKKLHQLLKNQILKGTYKVGGLLPSENQLSKEYSINRMTVRHALDELVNEGLIAKKPGKGSVVITNRKSLGLLSFKGFSEVIGSSEYHAKTIELSKPYVAEWDDPFFYPLSQKEIDNGCIQMERLRLANDVPFMLEFTYIPNDNLSGICESQFVNDSLFNTLQVSYQIEVVNVEQDIRAIGAQANIADLLEVNTDTPLIHIYRKYNTSKKDFYIYSSLYCNTENYTIGNKF